MRLDQKKKLLALGGGGLLLLITFKLIGLIPFVPQVKKSFLSKQNVSHILEPLLNSDASSILPKEIDLTVKNHPTRSLIEYTLDTHLQVEVEALFHTYKPDYGAFVAIEPTTGKVLALVSYNHGQTFHENIALKGGFPSASIFKVITAAAALETGKLNTNSIIPFNGRSHTLYRRNVFSWKENRYTRYMTLTEAFGKSVNPIFGRIGALYVEPEELKEFARNFGFNREIASDLPFAEGHAKITHDEWERAETASGFTLDNTMSPLQGALIASAIVNNGVMMEPYIVKSVHSESGESLYSGKPSVSTVSVSEQTAQQIRKLMQETVLRGTAKSAFRTFFRRSPLRNTLEIGGKTGSLTGLAPKGKYDWFVGYADNGEQKFAFSALTVHKEYWRVKSTYLARKAIETYFSDQIQTTSASPTRKKLNPETSQSH